jgi:hypothetical protein
VLKSDTQSTPGASKQGSPGDHFGHRGFLHSKSTIASGESGINLFS